MPKFGVTLEKPKGHVTQGLLSRERKTDDFPITVGVVYPTSSPGICNISLAAFKALFPGEAIPAIGSTIELDLRLLTPATGTGLTHGKVHASDPRTVRFEVIDRGIPLGVVLKIDLEYMRHWTVTVWRKGCILERKAIPCRPYP